jgi:hypothetical protein
MFIDLENGTMMPKAGAYREPYDFHPERDRFRLFHGCDELDLADVLQIDTGEGFWIEIMRDAGGSPIYDSFSGVPRRRRRKAFARLLVIWLGDPPRPWDGS